MESAVEKNIKQQELKTLKVLIADDDPATRILLRAAVNKWGYEVSEAKNGQEAWELLKKPDSPRLLILDWLMPQLTGIDLCIRIKQELPHYQPYIILLTQVAGTENIIKGLEAGANEFLSKPFNMAELQSRLSVGARIIKYEAELAEQNKKLQDDVTDMETLAALTLELSKQTDEIVKLSKTLAGKEGKNYLKKIEELHVNLTHIVDVIKDFQKKSKN